MAELSVYSIIFANLCHILQAVRVEHRIKTLRQLDHGHHMSPWLSRACSASTLFALQGSSWTGGRRMSR